MTIQLNFDASTVEPTVAFTALPADDYMVCLTGAKVEATKAGDGHYLRCDYVVQEGPYKGRHLFENLNLWSKSQQATEIAWRELSGLCHAAGVLQVATIDQLFGILVVAKVAVEHSEQYGDQNTIRAFSKVTGPAFGPAVSAPQPPYAPAAAPAAPQPAPTAAPWAKPGSPAPAPAAAPTAAPTAAPPWAQQAPTPEGAAPDNSDLPPWAR